MWAVTYDKITSETYNLYPTDKDYKKMAKAPFVESAVFKNAGRIKPQFNIGAGFDIPTGRYHIGKDGESILNGGHPRVTCVAGRGNMFKSTLCHYFNYRVLSRYHTENGGFASTRAFVYDTEDSMNVYRQQDLLNNVTEHTPLDIVDEDTPYFRLTDLEVLGNVYFDGMLKMGADKIKSTPKRDMWTTPFLDSSGGNIVTLPLTSFNIDSMSMMAIGAVEEIYKKGTAGDSALNTEAMKSGAAKTQMLMQLAPLTNRANFAVAIVAHVGDDVPMDKYAASTKKLSFLQENVSLKHVPEKMSFVANNLYMCYHSKVLRASDKSPEYPRHKDDRSATSTDLQEVSIINLRGKFGATGIRTKVLCSQDEGLLPELTEFHICKENEEYKRFGMIGNMTTYQMALKPDVNIMRTTIRKLVKENKQLARAINFTAELCQIHMYWKDYDRELLCDPETLYADLKELGYDWDVLLNTRGYWLPIGHDHPQEFLSTQDLLRMRKGLYHPKWYPALPAKVEK